MPPTTMTPTRLEMRWTPVVDDRGRTRMEAHWVEASTAAASAISATGPAGTPGPTAPAPRPVPATAGHAA